jgi:hypothetical protein
MSDLKLQSHGNVMLRCGASGQINLNGELDFGSSYNQNLKKFQNSDLSGVTGGYEMIVFDGDAYSHQAIPDAVSGGTGINVTAGAVSVDDSVVALKSYVDSEISTATTDIATLTAVAATYETITTVSGIDSRLTTVEGAYLSSSSASSTYETIANVSSVSSRVSTLEAAGPYALDSALTSLDGRVSSLESDASTYLTTADKDDLVLNNSVSVVKTNCAHKVSIYKLDCANNGVEAVASVALDNEVAAVEVQACIKGSLQSGTIYLERVYEQFGSADASELAASDRFIGDLEGTEVGILVDQKNLNIRVVGNVSSGSLKAVVLVKVLKRVAV